MLSMKRNPYARNWFDLLVELVKTNFKLRYNSSFLGILWVLIKPYLTFTVLYVIWSKLGANTLPHYQLYLLIGVIFYTYFNELIVFGQMSLLDRAGIILKVNFPRQIATISSLLSAVINLSINLILVLVIAAIQGVFPSPAGLLYMVFIILLIFIYALAIAFFTSIVTVRLRDLKNIIELAIFLLYWATPIFFVVNSSLADGITAKVLESNPLGILFNQVRAVFNVYGEVNLPLMGVYLVIGLVLVVFGWYYFNHKVKQIAEYF